MNTQLVISTSLQRDDAQWFVAMQHYYERRPADLIRYILRKEARQLGLLDAPVHQQSSASGERPSQLPPKDEHRKL